MPPQDESAKKRAGIFSDTPWTEITYRPKAAVEKRQRAQAEFCRIYRQPVYLLTCRAGFNPTEAEDVTQDFLLHFLRSEALTRAERSKGRFRDFLTAALRHYLSNVRERQRARKRGGHFVHVGLDDPAATKLAESPNEDNCRPGETRNMLSSLGEALRELEASYARKGRGSLFRWLKQGRTNSAAMAARLHRSPATLRSDAKRFRAQLRRLLLLKKRPDC